MKIEEALKTLASLSARLSVFWTESIHITLIWHTGACLFSMFVKLTRATTFLLGLLSGIK